jgi:hypothetical protein
MKNIFSIIKNNESPTLLKIRDKCPFQKMNQHPLFKIIDYEI